MGNERAITGELICDPTPQIPRRSVAGPPSLCLCHMRSEHLQKHLNPPNQRISNLLFLFIQFGWWLDSNEWEGWRLDEHMLQLVFFISFECESLCIRITTKSHPDQSERRKSSICKVTLNYMVKIMSLWQQSMLLCTCGLTLLIANTGLWLWKVVFFFVRVTRVWCMFREYYKFHSNPLKACYKRWSGGGLSSLLAACGENRTDWASCLSKNRFIFLWA